MMRFIETFPVGLAAWGGDRTVRFEIEKERPVLTRDARFAVFQTQAHVVAVPQPLRECCGGSA
jgi:hypothetical protein